MTSTKALLGVVMAVALSACSSPARFDNASGANGAGTGTGAGADGISTSVLDPTSIGYFDQTVGNTINFAVDESTLSDAARQVLLGQAQWLRDNPGFVAVIEGHADEQGTR